jgi:hypothetical protein
MNDLSSQPTVRRVLALSGMDGCCMTLFSGFCTGASLLTGEWGGALVGSIVLSCGITTLCNRKRLMRGEVAGLSWLFRVQLMVVLVVFLYVVKSLLAYDASAMDAALKALEGSSLMGGLLDTALEQWGISVESLRALMKPIYFSFYLIVMSGTLLFQGGLALFYWKSRARVRDELTPAS